MERYIVTLNGLKLSEDDLRSIYIAFETKRFEEQEYKAWKFDKLASGVIKFAE